MTSMMGRASCSKYELHGERPRPSPKISRSPVRLDVATYARRGGGARAPWAVGRSQRAARYERVQRPHMSSTERTGRECIDRVRHNTDDDANSEISRVRCAPVANADSLLLLYSLQAAWPEPKALISASDLAHSRSHSCVLTADSAVSSKNYWQTSSLRRRKARMY